jgi:hypothetical protein
MNGRNAKIDAFAERAELTADCISLLSIALTSFDRGPQMPTVRRHGSHVWFRVAPRFRP